MPKGREGCEPLQDGEVTAGRNVEDIGRRNSEDTQIPNLQRTSALMIRSKEVREQLVLRCDEKEEYQPTVQSESELLLKQHDRASTGTMQRHAQTDGQQRCGPQRR